MNGETFLGFVRRSLIPILPPFDEDNPRSIVIHHIQEVTDLITATGALLRFLLPYSPDLNPIELAFSKVKAFLKANDTIFHSNPGGLCRIYTSLWIRVTCYTIICTMMFSSLVSQVYGNKVRHSFAILIMHCEFK